MNETTIARAVAAAESDGEFSLFAREWHGVIHLRCGERGWRIPVAAGRLGPAVPCADAPDPGPQDVIISGEPQNWARLLSPVPPPGFVDWFGAQYAGIMSVRAGSPLDERRYGAMRRLCELLRHAHNGTDPTPQVAFEPSRHGEHDRAVGRYIHLDIDRLDHRVYYEESGRGIGLLCQHTAGSDSRQWRHLLEDDRVTDHFRVIAYDLPYHGKSLPSSGEAWWARKYSLTKERAMAVPRALAQALGLDRPVFLGSSVGGQLALDLARYHPDDFRAVIACEATLKLGGEQAEGRPSDRPAAPDPGVVAMMMMWSMPPAASEALRHEVRLHYAQGAPGVFAGDIDYFSFDHDLRGEAHLIDTERCPVHLFAGEYDYATVPAARLAHEQIPGSTFHLMEGLGHFPMSEDPGRFIDAVLPVLEDLAMS
jgi:pimeloyl-ACP methyl ester carboxylesterase